MAKDAKGHGSEKRGGGGHVADMHAAIDAHERASANGAVDQAERGELGSMHSANQDAAAANTLGGGHPKASAVPVHGGMSNPSPFGGNGLWVKTGKGTPPAGVTTHAPSSVKTGGRLVQSGQHPPAWASGNVDRTSDGYHEYNRDLKLRSRNGQVGSGMKFRG